MLTDNKKEYFKQYYIANRDKMLARTRAYYAANKETYVINKAVQVVTVIEEPKVESTIKNDLLTKKDSKGSKMSKEYYKEYYIKNRDYILDRQKKYNTKNKAAIAAKKQEYIYPSQYTKLSYTVASKQAKIKQNLAALLVKKDAFKKKLAEEAETINNNIIIP